MHVPGLQWMVDPAQPRGLKWDAGLLIYVIANKIPFVHTQSSCQLEAESAESLPFGNVATIIRRTHTHTLNTQHNHSDVAVLLVNIVLRPGWGWRVHPSACRANGVVRVCVGKILNWKYIHMCVWMYRKSFYVTHTHMPSANRCRWRALRLFEQSRTATYRHTHSAAAQLMCSVCMQIINVEFDALRDTLVFWWRNVKWYSMQRWNVVPSCTNV